MRVTVEERRPTVAEYAHLRAAVGWSVPAESLVAAALAATTVAAVAVVDGVAVGMGRVVGDGALYSLLVDLVVDPRFQDRGVGGRIVSALERMTSTTGARPVLNVVADPDVARYYLDRGYQETASHFLQRSV